MAVHAHDTFLTSNPDQYRHQKKHLAYKFANDTSFRENKMTYVAEYKKNRYNTDQSFKEKILQSNRDLYAKEAAIRYLKKLFK